VLDGPVGSWFQMVGKVPTLLWRWLVLLFLGYRWQGWFLPSCGVGWSCWFLVPDGSEGSYLVVALAGTVFLVPDNREGS
jgi:hypothetical protein